MTAHTDPNDPRLDELLLRWEELHDQGQSLSAEEVCSTCPELAAELARRIALLRKMDPLLDEATTAPGNPAPAAPAGGSSRVSATARADFRDLRFHAAGALGEVFMARNAELNRDVALKFLKPGRSGDPDSLRRFLQEAEVTGRLEHPGVVPIYALGTDGSGAPCYAMRFIRGETLQGPIDAFHNAEKAGRDPSERSLALRELLNRFVSICNTMAYAHSRGILHRDLKPRNVMLGKYDETLVVDWGLAKPFDRDESARLVGEETLMPSSGSGLDTPTVGVVGTPAYMSPEQAEAQSEIVGPTSDIFGLGAILYAILTGHPPYQGRTIGEVLEKVKRCEFPAPRQVRPVVSRALEAVCLTAMAAKPEDRYASALDLAADVRRWLADEPVTAFAEPLVVRTRRWMRRHRTLVTTATGVMVFGLAILAGFAAVLAGKNRELDAKNVALADKNRQLDAKNLELADKNRQLDAKNLELAGKNQELDKQRRRAEERETLAIEAVTKFCDAVRASPELKDRPEVESLRKALLKEPLEFFQRLRDQLQADRDTRPEALAKLANANFVLAYTTSEIGSITDAIRSYSESIAIRERLARDNPAVTQFQSDLAASYYRIGTLLQDTGRPNEAMESCKRALAIFERLAHDNPKATKYQSSLGASHSNIGMLLHATGHPKEALESYRRALAIRERLVGDNPTSVEYQSELAGSQLVIGHILMVTNHPAEALESVRRSQAIFERLARQNPAFTPYEANLAATHIHIGLLLGATNRPAEALESQRRALAIRERLARDHPAVTVYQSHLSISHDFMGALLNQMGHPVEALESYRRALGIRERLVRNNPSVINFQSDLALTLNHLAEIEMGQRRWHEARELLEQAIKRQRAALEAMPHHPAYQSIFRACLFNLAKIYQALNQPAEVVRAARDLATLAHGNPNDLYNAACVLACSIPLLQEDQKKAQATYAVQILKAAVAAGWNNARHTSRDPDLAPLRDRDDFRRLLAEMFDRGFPANPFTR